MPEEVFSRLARIVEAQLGVRAEEIKPETEFVEDLCADSLDLVELVIAAEEEFDLMFDDGDVVKLRTVQDAVSCIEGLLKEEADG